MSEQEEELTPTPRGSPTVQRTLGEPEEHPATSPEGQRHYSEVRSDEEILNLGSMFLPADIPPDSHELLLEARHTAAG